MDLFLSEDSSRKPLGFGNTDIRGGILENDAAFVQEGKEAPDSGNVNALRPESTGSAVPCFPFLEKANEGKNVFFRDGTDIANTFCF